MIILVNNIKIFWVIYPNKFFKVDNNAGLLERTVNHLLLKYDVKEYEVLISVIGFTEEKAIDLLNLE